MKILFGFIAALLSLVLPARAWNAEGHMVVAQVAYNHLQPDVKARCDTLIAVPLSGLSSTGTSNFITAAAWADDFKSTLGTGIWHYIDIPISLDGTSTAGVAPDAFDVVRAIRLCLVTLQDPAAGQATQAVCLRYLIHFVGDIQQPLHCSTAVTAALPGGDAGGNDFDLKGTWTELHALWDAGGGFLTDSVNRPLSSSSKTTLNNKVALVESAYPYDYTTNLNVVPDPMTWAVEGWQIAKTVSYVGVTNNLAPSAGYLSTASSTTEQRMAAGGHRLADLLNTIMGTNAVSLKSLAVTNSTTTFSWNALVNRSYRVQWKQNLDDPAWNDLTNIVGTTNAPIFIRDSLGQPQRFYRVTQ